MGNALSVLIISDGKLGHENQSRGLAEAIARLTPTEIHRVKLDLTKSFFSRLQQSFSTARSLPKPHIILAAGHSTHLPALLIAKKTGSCCVSLMKPSLPLCWFFCCICPEHDFIQRSVPKNVLLSKGALNRVKPKEGEKKGKILLIGGPSKTHGWDEAALLAQMETKLRDEKWLVADSRRTPQGFLKTLKDRCPQVEIFPHEQAPHGWLSEKLCGVEQVLVTEDSVSMIYESLSSGAKVEILDMPRLRKQSRLIQALEAMKQEGYFDPAQPLPTLAEADRCAALLLADYEKRRR